MSKNPATTVPQTPLPSVTYAVGGVTIMAIARLDVSTSHDNSYHQIERHENVPVVSKNGDPCN